MKRGRKWKLAGAAVALTLSGSLFAGEIYLAAKGRLAEVLIAKAFEEQREQGDIRRPWSWADHYPLAKLEVPRLGVTRYVLSGASGSSLAFGLGHIDGSALPNADGNCVVAGHRDSWAGFLGELKVGDTVKLTDVGGSRRWQVEEIRIVPWNDGSVGAADAGERLTLVTCFPVNGMGPSDLRLVVVCRAAQLTPHPEPNQQKRNAQEKERT